MSESPSTVVGILDAATRWLTARKVDSPRRSVELLMGRVLGLDRLRLYLAHDRPLSTAERDQLRDLVRRRGDHEPLAYLLGDWEFYGHVLEVSPAVLIPRAETEGLVDRALACIDAGADRVVDLGTGSGAIAIAVARARPTVRVVAVDVSADALAIASRNVERHRLTDRIELRRGSWWEPFVAGETFDLVVSNPPYCDPAHDEDVAADVQRFEPALALWSPRGQPQAHYRTIAAGAREHLQPGGWLLFETGLWAAESSRDALLELGEFDGVELEPDLEGRPRYLKARRSASVAR